MKRRIAIFCCTFAAALGTLAVAAPASADDCPYGTVPTRFPGVCTQGQSGSAPPALIVPPSGATPVIAPGSIPTINGIPCNDAHSDTCWAFQQNG